MVGAVGAFINIIQQTLPDLLARFDSLWASVAPGMEDRHLGDLYAGVPVTDFSDQVLSARPSGLAVMRARGLGWTDLGEPERVLSIFPLHKGARRE